MDKSEKKCLIISGGEYDDIFREDTGFACGVSLPEEGSGKCAESYNDNTGYDLILACDRGLDHALAMGLAPDTVLGDLDSVSAGGKKYLETQDIRCIRFPREKDDTDTMAAIMHALKLGYRHIDMICAYGGRRDHEFGNIQAAFHAAARGAVVRLLADGTETVIFSSGSIKLKKRPGYGFSVFALSDECLGVYIRNARYELNDARMTNDSPRGVSNEFTAPEAEISVEKGVLMTMTVRLTG
ncbi:MAG: thiamine diphosphokinase [Lachnospiraceae bacterium]|nr:thiamine diphosphokinase [Lachnospiraceae bacterium]